ncbi:sigma-70 family RNA polymerase sigma factor [Rhizobiales bacterium RZME27]|uniref:Sigma-70 family RNA polymerase sigma factor n=2 Tax=Endobacterium cereale TaxID=2663029 RepID=A0A6A8A8A0_9HYPH|nr:sigma-70 family RNA polymerase sigma factor [Endobacterium cereale]
MGMQSNRLGTLYVSEKNRLSRMIARIFSNRNDVEDIVHDAFIRFITARLGGIDQEKAYIARIAQNLAIDAQRKAKKHPSADIDLFEMIDPSPSPEQVVADRQALAITLSALEKLPGKTRRAFEMHRVGDMTITQIASELGISSSNAGRHVIDGYQLLRDALRRHGL